MEFLIGCLIVMSILLLVMMGIDKFRAVRYKWRISERMLFLLALLFGAPGGMIGMLVFRHKIRDTRFRLLFPIFAVLQIAVVVLARYFNVIPFIFY